MKKNISNFLKNLKILILVLIKYILIIVTIVTTFVLLFLYLTWAFSIIKWYEEIYLKGNNFTLLRKYHWPWDWSIDRLLVSACYNYDLKECLFVNIDAFDKKSGDFYLYINKYDSIVPNINWKVIYNFWQDYDKKVYVNTKNDIPDLIKLSDKIEYFNSKDFDWVSEKDKEIFEKIIAEANTEGFDLVRKLLDEKNVNK